jgi:DNA-binding MarR family transcriptional regulator
MGNPQRLPATHFLQQTTRGVGPAKVVSIKPDLGKSECACELARRASRAVSQLYDLVLSPTKLKASQFILLRNIAEAEEIAQCEISKTLSVAVETLTRRLATMRKAGWVQLRMGADRRERLYSITDLGREQLNAAQPYWNRAEQRLREQLGPEAWQRTQACLVRLGDAAVLSLSARRKNTIAHNGL